MIYTYRTAALPTEEFPPDLYRIPSAQPKQTPAPTPAPTATPQQDPCIALLQSWAQQNPQLVKCLNNSDASAMITACHAMQSGRMTQAQAMQSIQSTVGAACARSAPPQSPPPPSTTTPAPQQQPPPSGGGGAQPGSSPGGSPSGGGDGSPQSAPSASPLRRWGPVVGVVILLGAGVYYVRKK